MKQIYEKQRMRTGQIVIFRAALKLESFEIDL